MPRIRCRYIGCVYLEEEYCTASFIDLDPDIGCQSFSQGGDLYDDVDDDWDEDEEDDFEGWEEEDFGEEWLEEDDF